MSTVTHASWPIDDIDDALAADFDGSLSGLGIELGTASFNMSDTLMALPNIANAPTHIVASESRKKNRPGGNDDETVTIKRFCKVIECPPARSAVARHGGSAPDLSCRTSRPEMKPVIQRCDHHPNTFLAGTRFQYVLLAATSIATKINETTMTYLNQFQPYELKLKKLGDLTEMQGKLLHSIVRIGFQERRLQYAEQDLFLEWYRLHPRQRIMEIDVALSYGLYDPNCNTGRLQEVEFSWDPTKETGVFIKFNCISTEFTQKKHGGEKGVPFRLIVETFTADGERIHAAACQVKIFKPKGADRKHKTDREKMNRKPNTEQELFQPSYDCTFFTELSNDIESPVGDGVSVSPPRSYSPGSSSVADASHVTSVLQESSDASISPSPIHYGAVVSVAGPLALQRQDHKVSLTLDWATSVFDTAQWLEFNRFHNHLGSLKNFNGADLLSLSRNDLIELCGKPDGFRLYNLLHTTQGQKCKTIYVAPKLASSSPNSSSSSLVDVPPTFHAIYLSELSARHLLQQLALDGVAIENGVFLEGPSGIHILVTDSVVRNIANESVFLVSELELLSGEKRTLLLPYTSSAPGSV